MRYAFQPLLIAYIVQCVSVCNGSLSVLLCFLWNSLAVDHISIDFVRREMHNAVPISLLLFHECALVMHTCTLNCIWCMCNVHVYGV